MKRISTYISLLSILYIIIYFLLLKSYGLLFFVLWIVLPLILSAISFYLAKKDKNPFFARLLSVLPMLINICIIIYMQKFVN